MAALKGQPAPKPSALNSPVPSANAQDEADSFLASFEAPQMEASAPAGDEADAFLNSFQSAEAPVAEVPQELAPPDDQFSEESASNFVDRLKTGLAADSTEQLNYLKQKYGPQNAAIKNGELYFRKDPKGKLKRLDPDTMEFFNDLITDNARTAVTEATLLPSEIVGGFTMGPGGAVVGRAAGVPVANSFADGVAQMAGVPQNESRDRRNENLMGMVTEGVAPVVGKYLKKFIPGTAPYKAAKEAGQREAVALTDQSKEVIDSLLQLEKESINLPMMSHQIHPDSPYLLRTALKAEEAYPGRFIQRQNEVAQGYGQALTNTLGEIARRNGHGPVAPEKLAFVVTNAVESLDTAEGKAIGALRAKAMAKMGGKKFPLPQETTQEAMRIMKELGFTPRTKEIAVKLRRDVHNPVLNEMQQVGQSSTIKRTVWNPPANIQPIIGRLGLDDSQTRSVVNIINEYGQIVSRGGEARLQDVERLIKRMGPLNRKLGGTGISGTWGKMTGELRQFRRQLITGGLDEVEGKIFNGTMDDFAMIRQNTEQLSNVLRADITAKTMVNGFFKGKENLANIRAIKSITGAKSPEWGALKEEFVNQLLLKHADNGPTGVNSTAFLKDLKVNYGDDFIKEVMNDGVGPDYDSVKNLLTVGQRIEAMTKGAKVETLSKKQEDALANTAIGFFAGIKFKLINGATALIKGTGKDENAMMEIFNRNGYEKYVAGYKGDKTNLIKNIEAAMEIYNNGRAQSKIVRGAEEVVKRGTKGEIREETQR